MISVEISSRVKTFIVRPLFTGVEEDSIDVEKAMDYLDKCVNELEKRDIISVEDTIIPIVLPVRGHCITRLVHYVPYIPTA